MVLFGPNMITKSLAGIVVFILLQNSKVYSQVNIGGKIVEEDNSPVPFASVKLMKQPEGIISDNAGNFSLNVSSVKNNDTLIITSIGHEVLKIPARMALSSKQHYILKQVSRKLENVTVRSFTKEAVDGAKTDIVGYFRSWRTNNRGGEIGRAFNVPYKEYQVTKVRFKIFSSCDTCIIRVHVRELLDGEPGDELLKDSVAQVFVKAYITDKTYDFDLSRYNLVLSKKDIFVSFEVLNGSLGGSGNCSLAFAGSETGSYMYKSERNDYWDNSDEYSIYMKVSFLHD